MASNWDRIRKQKPTDTAKYRDVYEDQQLERSSMAKKESMLTRNILNAVICIMVFALSWFLISIVQIFIPPERAAEEQPDPQYQWIYADKFYISKTDSNDRISPSEYEALVSAYDPNIPVVDEPVKPEKPENPKDTYESQDDGYSDKKHPDIWISESEYDALVEEYELKMDIYNADMETYEADMARYEEYVKAVTDPKETYVELAPHYCDRHDFNNMISVDDYNKLCAEYEAEKSQLSEDLLSLPAKPYNPAAMYIVSKTGDIPKKTPDGEYVYKIATDEDGDELYDDYGNPVTEIDEYGNPVVDVVHDQPIEYRNKCSAATISRDEYNQLVSEYEIAVETYNQLMAEHNAKYHPELTDGPTLSMAPNKIKAGISFGIAAILFIILFSVFQKNLKAQNAAADTADINQYHNDQHVALPEEVQKNYDWFPDVGAHSSVQVSSMISHMALTNKGLKTVQLAKRADKDILDEDGNVLYFKGEILNDEHGNPITSTVPMIDEAFMEDLFEASGAPKDKSIRKRYDTTKIDYNPDGSNRDKLKGYKTVADLINGDWEFPIYEPQRPGGAYIVDTAPVNTMVLAITRAGKGQTVIEPTLDMWMREKRPNNMVVNDPKGELLVKNYVRATVRGLQVVQFNLINAMKTDIYNPLALAAEAARDGDNTKCAMYVENIAEVFFPVDGGEDPLWPNAANNAFKRAAYGLIDYYLEEEKAMRRMAERTGMDETILEQRLDSMWGKVTLYNCYQLFVQMTSKKMKNPMAEFQAKVKAGDYNDVPEDVFNAELEKIKKKSELWEDKPEADLLTLFFSATDVLPKNSMRTLVGNANNALKAIGGAEKMISSVYGIAITAMSFFTDPTISTLTSGTPSQNIDLGSLSFPRRMGVRFHPDYIDKYHFVGQQAIWNAYEDPSFEKCLGKDFYHEDMVSREGWARYYFDGKFKSEIAYVKLEIKNPTTGSLIRTFYFEFKKSYQTSLDGRVYVKDPVLEEKIVKNGILTELRKFKKKDGTIVYMKARTTFEQEKILDFTKVGEKIKFNTNAIVSMQCRYAEKPKMVFLVTPPHLMKYAKLILILIKQLVDMNFDKSYMTKSNQKPLYKTRFMLDELGLDK